MFLLQFFARFKSFLSERAKVKKLQKQIFQVFVLAKKIISTLNLFNLTTWEYLSQMFKYNFLNSLPKIMSWNPLQE